MTCGVSKPTPPTLCQRLGPLQEQEHAAELIYFIFLHWLEVLLGVQRGVEEEDPRVRPVGQEL